MGLNNALTNESLNKLFDNPFQIVNAAIKIAKRKIGRGEQLTADPATKILNMIAITGDLSPDVNDEEDEDIVD
jgi:hypothetical protein